MIQKNLSDDLHQKEKGVSMYRTPFPVMEHWCCSCVLEFPVFLHTLQVADDGLSLSDEISSIPSPTPPGKTCFFPSLEIGLYPVS